MCGEEKRLRCVQALEAEVVSTADTIAKLVVSQHTAAAASPKPAVPLPPDPPAAPPPRSTGGRLHSPTSPSSHGRGPVDMLVRTTFIRTPVAGSSCGALGAAAAAGGPGVAPLAPGQALTSNEGVLAVRVPYMQAYLPQAACCVRCRDNLAIEYSNNLI